MQLRHSPPRVFVVHQHLQQDFTRNIYKVKALWCLITPSVSFAERRGYKNESISKIKAINPFTNPKKLKKLALTTIILLVIICLCQTFLLINLSKPKPTSFLRFADYHLGASIVKFDKSLKYSVPLEAALLSKTFTHKSTTEKRSRRKEFFEENKNIQDYLDDEENILASSIADKTNKAESFIILHFDLPRMLYVSARTEDGENIPIVKKDKWKLLDTSQFYAKPNEVTTIYLTADDNFYTYEYMFRLKIRFI